MAEVTGEIIGLAVVASAVIIGGVMVGTHGPTSRPTCWAYDPVTGVCVTDMPCGEFWWTPAPSGQVYSLCTHGCVSVTSLQLAPDMPTPICGNGDWADPCTGQCGQIPICQVPYSFDAGLCVLKTF